MCVCVCVCVFVCAFVYDQGSLDTAQRRLEEVEEQLADKTKEVDKALGRCAELQAKIDAPKSPKSPHLGADVAESSEAVTELRRELERVRDAAEEDLESERARCKQLEESLEVSSERVAALEVSVAAAEERLKSSEEHWSKRIAEKEEGIDRKIKLMGAQQQEVSEELHARHAEEIAVFESKIKQLEEEVEEKKSEVMELEEAFGQLEAEERLARTALDGVQGKWETKVRKTSEILGSSSVRNQSPPRLSALGIQSYSRCLLSRYVPSSDD